MKICIVGPGMMSIPPTGWGAVEILIDDYRNSLEQLGHDVHIVNTKDMNLAAFIINNLSPDFVHIQYDDYIDLAKDLMCENIAITSHYAYLENKTKWNRDYKNFFIKTCISNVNVFCLSKGIADTYRDACVSDDRIFVTRNGVRNDLFSFTKECPRPNDSIYLAKIDERKGQYKYRHIENLWYYGGISDSRFPDWHPRYLGEISKKELYKDLTQWANLVLLSDGEAHPLVCMEALSAGLGLVISECATSNLDLSLPFIDVIPNDRLDDIEFIAGVIDTNRKISIAMRDEIKEYSQTFSWLQTVENYYLPAVESVLGKK
ncbi:MAG: hypothetical protein CMB77_04480 [Euryarchaeota archaeon]|nr:hypothetical protein [Euryarchaeota archaeon]|tara:strand:+ start:13160 stop:14113 length:954 start_codon:yes stop_codon:yes gene_type:complete